MHRHAATGRSRQCGFDGGILHFFILDPETVASRSDDGDQSGSRTRTPHDVRAAHQLIGSTGKVVLESSRHGCDLGGHGRHHPDVSTRGVVLRGEVSGTNPAPHGVNHEVLRVKDLVSRSPVNLHLGAREGVNRGGIRPRTGVVQIKENAYSNASFSLGNQSRLDSGIFELVHG